MAVVTFLFFYWGIVKYLTVHLNITKVLAEKICSRFVQLLGSGVLGMIYIGICLNALVGKAKRDRNIKESL